ncbi:hypothetical protein RRG08_064054 [Elysia crispata]|uniref:Uncharacterized protein n=1 Tax=Elysia crispata TaxID=231223 RepID=A0AAE1CXK7_9GAST|nr:hypothetical protein RRG08_064054 [Elysia crispata]
MFSQRSCTLGTAMYTVRLTGNLNYQIESFPGDQVTQRDYESESVENLFLSDFGTMIANRTISLSLSMTPHVLPGLYQIIRSNALVQHEI